MHTIEFYPFERDNFFKGKMIEKCVCQDQCDKIGRFLNFLMNQLSYKKVAQFLPNIAQKEVEIILNMKVALFKVAQKITIVFGQLL